MPQRAVLRIAARVRPLVAIQLIYPFLRRYVGFEIGQHRYGSPPCSRLCSI